MLKFNWFGIAAGALILIVLAISFYYPWWQLVVGDNLLQVNASPVYTNFGLLDTQFTIPLIWALNVTSILTFLVSGIFMLIYAFFPTKSYSKELLGFSYRKPLYAIVFSVIGLLIPIVLIRVLFGFNIPLMGTSTLGIPAMFASALPGVDVSVLVSAGFMVPFWLAIVAAGLCIVARVYHGRVFGDQPASYAVSADIPPHL
jgi:hypothetical protein